MDTQSLPLVPFGKYKGQPITTLMNDTKYLEWFKQQELLQKFPIVYNICVNQTITTTNQNSKTPEHNKLQNMFLNKKNQMKLLNRLIGSNIGVKFKQRFELLILDEEFIRYFDSFTITHVIGGDPVSRKHKKINNFVPEFYRSLIDTRIVFEDKYNWDFVLYYNDYQTINFKTKCDVAKRISADLSYRNTQLIDKVYNIIKKYNFGNDHLRDCGYIRENDLFIIKEESNYEVCIQAVLKSINIFCELKPILSDDYPCVLRKLKTQIELTENGKKEKSGIYVLLIGSFTSKYTSKEELITIFKQSNINVIFTEEIFGTSKGVEVEINTNTQKLLSYENENKLIEENKHLTNNLLQTQEKLLQAEERIKQLEEEIIIIKSQKPSKSIKDYFGKK